MNLYYILLVPVALILLVCFGLAVSVINLWVRALFAEAPVRIRDLIGMKLRHVPPSQVRTFPFQCYYCCSYSIF